MELRNSIQENTKSILDEIFMMYDINSLMLNALKFEEMEGANINISKYIYMIEIQLKHIEYLKKICET